MKKLTLLSVICIYLITCSCGKMHIFYVQSNIKSNDSVFMFENDTVRIVYQLWDNKGRMHFEVYNKLSVPLFIDWKNSSFILDDVPKQYWSDKTVSQSRTSGSGSSSKGSFTYSSNSNGTAIHADRVSLIPPHSKVIKDYGRTLCKSEIPTALDRVKHFRNYIAYSINEDTKEDKFIDNDFQVVEVKSAKRNQLRNYKNDKLFYTYK